MPQLILFDLDGTLVDTAPDLGLALNMQRQNHGLPALAESVIRPYASHGSRGLLQIGFGLSPEHEQFESMRQEYLALYDEVFTMHPVLFNCMDSVLASLEQQQIAWGVVTNKPRRFSEPLLNAMGLYERAVSVVCGDDAPRPKPAPDTLNMACAQAGVSAQSTWYVGDAERDIQAGKAADMATVLALYGYLSEGDNPQSWQADFTIEEPVALLELIALVDRL